jgi:hypothetical protein
MRAVSGMSVGGAYQTGGDDMAQGHRATSHIQDALSGRSNVPCGDVRCGDVAANAEAMAVRDAVLRAMRVSRELGVGPHELAEEIGVPFNTLSNWARADRLHPIPAHRLMQLCRVLPAAASAALWAELGTLAEQGGAGTPADRQPLRTQACEVAAAAGDVSAAVLRSTCDGSAGGADLTEDETREIALAVGELVTESIELAVAASANRGKLPNGQMAKGPNKNG